jgi:preprotein translocase subunit SecF
MINLATIKAKVIIGLGIAALLGAAFFYFKNLNGRIDNLNKQNIELSSQVTQSKELLKENDRMDNVVNTVDAIGNQERVVIREIYDSKVKKVDKYVQEGKDRPVGPLLDSFFNDGLHDEN